MLSVPPEQLGGVPDALCESEGVEATIIGKFVDTGRLRLKYHGTQVADLDMEFLHDGRPPVVREADYSPPPVPPLRIPDRRADAGRRPAAASSAR